MVRLLSWPNVAQLQCRCNVMLAKPEDFPVLHLNYKGVNYSLRVISMCPMCDGIAVVPLPPAILAEQPDKTTHVCLKCNQGYALDEPCPDLTTLS